MSFIDDLSDRIINVHVGSLITKTALSIARQKNMGAYCARLRIPDMTADMTIEIDTRDIQDLYRGR